MTFLTFLSCWVPVGLWAGLIFFLSSLPGLHSGLGFWDVFLRKGAHIFEFAVLTALLLRAFSRSTRNWTPRALLMASGSLSLLYAISDEYHQSFVPGRGPSVTDVMIDSIGIMLIIFLHKKLSKAKEW